MGELAGKTVGGYPIEKLLFKGSYADTWQIQSSGAPLAAKIVHAEIQNEALSAEIAKGFDASRAAVHENLVVTYGAGVEPQIGAYCLQELIRGKSLRQIVLDGNKLAWRDLMITAEQLVAAVQALHAAKIVHGDIWPGSILITQDQDLKLEGAGSMMHVTRRNAELITGPALGYQAPEVLAGSPASVESDLYGVGATMYAILAAHDPYPPDSPDRLLQVVTSRKLSRATMLRDDLPPEADEIIGRLMAHDPTQRYGSAKELLADIRRLKEGKALASLIGGRPAGKPKPSQLQHARLSGLSPAVGAKTNPAMKAVSGRPSTTGKPPSGFNASVPKPGSGLNPTVKPPSGLISAVGKSNTGLRAIKEGTASKHIFGRLDTHVKSTIPQSDIEKRGDDLYHQGQLPLALNCWREALENSPHTGLKVKLELGERDLKRESYSNAMDEAKLCIAGGDYVGAIARAQEALVTAEDEPQRQECLRLESQAGEKLLAERQSNRIKMVIGGAVIFIGAAVALILLMRSGKTEPAPTPTAVRPPPPPAAIVPPAPLPPPAAPEVLKQYEIPNLGNLKATVSYPPNWIVLNTGLTATVRDERVAGMIVNRLPEGIAIADVLKEIRTGSTLDKATMLESSDSAFLIEDRYRVSRTAMRYTGDKIPRLHYYFIVPGPANSNCVAEFDGPEETFVRDVRAQMDSIMKSWQFAK